MVAFGDNVFDSLTMRVPEILGGRFYYNPLYDIILKHD